MDTLMVRWWLLYATTQHTYRWEHLRRGCGAHSLYTLFLVPLSKHLQLAAVRTTRLEGTFGQLSGTIQLPKYVCRAVCDNVQHPRPLPASPRGQELAAWPGLNWLPSCLLLDVPHKAPVFKQLKWILASQILYFTPAKDRLWFPTSAL